MTKWNFNENKNFIKVGDYKVLNLPYADKASKLLEKINTLILAAFISMELKEPRTSEINLLLSTPFHLQEMQLPQDQGEIIFEGHITLKVMAEEINSCLLLFLFNFNFLIFAN